jgi:retron-type reverse transcriptase
VEKKNKTYPLNQSPIFKLTTKRKAANLLKLTVKELMDFRHSDHFYGERDIPKKSGGVRHIENPARKLKIIQARLARLLGRIDPPDYLFCPVKGRCYVTNAARHRGNRIVRTLDVKKYFPNTPRRRVYWFFKTIMKSNSDVADILAAIATYKGHLPTGSPLSPIMAFYAYYDVWQNVDKLVKQAGATNSLYIDDLTISGTRVPDRLMWEIKKVIHRSGLRYHKEKTYRDHPAEVTGVVIVGHKVVPPNRQLLKKYRVRRAFHAAKSELEKERVLQQLNGLIGQTSQISSANTVLTK